MTVSFSARRFLIAYGVVLLVLLVTDGFWLGWAARDFYAREMANVMADPVRIAPAAIFYLAYPLGLIYLGLMPLDRAASVGAAALRCALVALFAYGTYDLTTLSVIRGWSVQLSLYDAMWGTFAGALAGAIAHRVTRDKT